MPPLDPTIPEPQPTPTLSEVDRAFLTLFLTGPGSLSAIAEETGLDVLTIAEKFLSPEIQAALATIEKAAAHLSRLHALLARPTAINTLAEVTADPKLNPIERRRAGSTLLRAAPPGYPHAPRGVGSVFGHSHSPHRAGSESGHPDAPRRVHPAQEPLPISEPPAHATPVDRAAPVTNAAAHRDTAPNHPREHDQTRPSISRAPLAAQADFAAEERAAATPRSLTRHSREPPLPAAA